MRTITIPATSANLGPGFDCLGLALSCYNSVSFDFMQSGLTIDLQNTDLGRIPADERNLIYRVFADTLRRYGRAVPGVHFAQKNGIPAMRGMGSSAACVVAGVVMANEYLGQTLDIQQMIDLCTEHEGHPDNILPALLGGFTVGCMDEKRVRYARFTPPENLLCAVFIPPFSLSTRKARAALPELVTLKDAVFNLSHASLLTAAIASGQIELLQYAMRDTLHQPYRMPLVPGYAEIVRIAQDAGAMATCLSGAGPTMISFLKSSEGFLDAVKPELKALGGGWKVRLLHIDPYGYRVE